MAFVRQGFTHVMTVHPSSLNSAAIFTIARYFLSVYGPNKSAFLEKQKGVFVNLRRVRARNIPEMSRGIFASAPWSGPDLAELPGLLSQFSPAGHWGGTRHFH
jgi:hypothetical protein